RDIAPEEKAAVTEPDRAFRPAHSRGDLFDAGEGEAIFLEAGVDDFYQGVGVAGAGLPFFGGAGAARRADHRSGCCSGAAGDEKAPAAGCAHFVLLLFSLVAAA